MPEFDVEPIEGEEAMDSTEKAGLWLSRIDEAKKSFREWNDICDGIDDVYARLSEFAFNEQDREFNLFWSNMQVLGPSIYARPPVPVVTPRFNDRRPLHRTSAELLERCAIVDFERSDINSVLLSIRDDLTVTSRGTAWVRYLNKEASPRSTEMVVSEWLYRRDFLHGPGRTWSEVEWVARRGWMDREDFQDRFDVDAFEFDDLINECKRNITEDYVYDENGGKVGVWEVWSKTDKRVYWVMEGYNDFLDDDEPPLKLEGFFPCPKPAYATCKRNTLQPVPEYMQYRDQLETINRLTNKIHELSNFLKVVGFYPGGVSDVSDVVQQALSEISDGQSMYPIGDWASVSSAGRMLEWLPTDQIAATIVQCVELRRQLIDDVYQIMGLSDIMRGSTEASETATAQQIKAQAGSVRIRDKQAEMVRIARDIIAIAAEVIAEHFSKETMEDMAQMNLPTDAEIKKQIKDIEADAKERLSQLEDEARETIEAAQQAVQQQMMQLEQQAQQAMADPQVQSDPQAMEQAQAQFAQQQQQIQQEIAAQQEQAQAQFAEQQQEIIGQAQQEVAKLAESVTIDQVFSFLRDQKLNFVILDVESDSTVYADEMAEKESRNQFMMAFGGAMQQLSALIQAEPGAAVLAGDLLRFSIAPYRAGRQLDGAIDTFIEQVQQRAGQPQADPQQEALQAEIQIQQQRLGIEQQKAEAQMAKVQADAQGKQADMQLKMADMQSKAQLQQAEAQTAMQQAQADLAKTAAEVEKLMAEVERIQAETGKAVTETTLAQRNSDIEGARAINDIANSSAQTANTIRQSERTVEGQTNGR